MALNDPWAFTALVPVHAGDQPAPFMEALSSVVHGATRPDEILICQDGPLPAPLDQAVRSWLDRAEVRLIRNPGPRGLHHNLNFALRQVRTPWIARADADDINLPRRFEAQLSFLSLHAEVAVLGGGIIEFWPDGRSRRKTMPRDHLDIVRWARWRNPINHMTAFARTAAVLDCGGYPDIPLKEDYALWLTMIQRGWRLANLEEDLVRARLGETFYQRRAGLQTLPSEFALFRLKRRVPGVGTAAALAALLARGAALALSGPARIVYEQLLR